MCKWWAPKVAYDVINQCLLLHGQFGYRTELPDRAAAARRARPADRRRHRPDHEAGHRPAAAGPRARALTTYHARKEEHRSWESWTTRSPSSPGPGRASAGASPRSSPPRAPPSSSPTSTRPPPRRPPRRSAAARSASAPTSPRASRSTPWSTQVHRQFGRIDVLVNNAGWDKAEPVRRLRPRRLGPGHRDQPLRRPAHLKAVLPIMAEQGSGSVVNLAPTPAGSAPPARPSTPRPRAGSSRSPRRSPGRWPATRSTRTACAPARPTPRCSPRWAATTRSCGRR